jgi:hypothetical protein
MTVTIDVTQIVVFRFCGRPDHISLWTTLPFHWPIGPVQTLDFTVPSNTGRDYARQHFPDVPVLLVNG